MSNEIVMYLQQILQKYQARDLTNYSVPISQLKATLQAWASSCFIEIVNSGSRAKGTAISLASDVDYLVSLTSNCNENWKETGVKTLIFTFATKEPRKPLPILAFIENYWIPPACARRCCFHNLKVIYDVIAIH